jgi:hypothetical protein
MHMAQNSFINQRPPSYPGSPEIQPKTPGIEIYPQKSPEVIPQRVDTEIAPKRSDPEIYPEKSPEIHPNPDENPYEIPDSMNDLSGGGISL